MNRKVFLFLLALLSFFTFDNFIVNADTLTSNPDSSISTYLTSGGNQYITNNNFSTSDGFHYEGMFIGQNINGSVGLLTRNDLYYNNRNLCSNQADTVDLTFTIKYWGITPTSDWEFWDTSYTNGVRLWNRDSNQVVFCQLNAVTITTGLVQRTYKCNVRLANNFVIIQDYSRADEFFTTVGGNSTYMGVSNITYNCLDQAGSIISNATDNTDEIIDSIAGWMTNSINNITSNINNLINVQNANQQQTNQRLDAINNADIDSSDKQAANTDAYTDYQNAEENLFDKMDEADIDDMQIAIDVNSSTWVWDRITSWLNSHSLLMSFLISMLSIGIIKMALGR